MKKILYLVVLSLLPMLQLQAQRARFGLTFAQELGGEAKVYVQPRTSADANSVTLRLRDGKFVGNIPVSDTGFYNVVVVANQSQMITTVYAGDAKSVELDVKLVDRMLVIDGTPENRVLSAFNATVGANARTLWTKSGMGSDELKALITSYSHVADSLLAAEKVAAPVKEFVGVWAYTVAYDAYTSIPRAQNIAASAIGFTSTDVLPQPQSVLDCDYASLFYSANAIINSAFPSSASLIEKMEMLYDNYSNEAVRTSVGGALMKSFMSGYNYSADFEGGLAQVKEAVGKYSLSDEYVKDYLKRKATIVGSAFPEGVVLQDADGNVVDFSAFKGKYVYIDLWASWCGPCRKEIPHLQAIEEQMKNGNVVFLSISTDADSGAWKKSMAELNLHGHQLHDRDNTLCDALNIKGIPFFLVYDKEGRLHTYGAMRPSKGALLKEFLEGLE